jgi:segregation and condensation protein A
MTQSIQSSPDQSGDTPEGEDVVVPAETEAENATTSADAFEEGGTRVEVASTEGSLVIDIDGFEGPLDVLLALARNQKVDLAKISILPLAEQYLEFINQAQRLELDLAADYLVMAAWLAFLKSKLLLPPPEEEEGPSGEEMAARLAFQLQRLEAMRNSSAELMKRLRMGVHVFQRGAPEGIRVTRTSVYTGTLYDLLKAYSEERIRALKPVTYTIKRQPVFAIDAARRRLEKMMGMMMDWDAIDAFLPTDFATGKERRTAVASMFSATLELTRDGHIEVQQSDPFSPVYVRKRATPRDDGNLDSDVEAEPSAQENE